MYMSIIKYTFRNNKSIISFRKKTLHFITEDNYDLHSRVASFHSIHSFTISFFLLVGFIIF